MNPGLPPPSPVLLLVSDLVALLRFFSRLPLAFLSRFPHDPPDFRRAIWMMPLAGAILGALAALAGLAAFRLGLSPLIAATIAVATLVATTGALHEDGLADSADGLFGGNTPERRLDIMRDSRIGTFGAAALILSLLVRILALGDILRLAGPTAFCLLAGIGALSRSLALLPAILLPPARKDGLSTAIPMPGAGAFSSAVAIASVLLFALALPFDMSIGAITGLAVAIAALAGFSTLARRRLGGQTGDILGASQQIVEIVLLLAFAATLSWIGPR